MDETGRLAALEEANILDSLPEQEFDDIVRIASIVCGTPMAVIGLVDRDRQWYKAKVGVASDEVSRDLSFCAHTILQENVLEVPDARKDSRFSDNPLVAVDPGIRFYAGAPLCTPEGHAIGTLCVYDQTPRRLGPEQREALAALGRLVTARIESRRLLAKAGLQDAIRAAPSHDFVNAVAHELATPLTSTMLQLRGLRRLIEDGTRDQRVRALDMLERNVNRLGDAAARIVRQASSLK